MSNLCDRENQLMDPFDYQIFRITTKFLKIATPLSGATSSCGVTLMNAAMLKLP